MSDLNLLISRMLELEKQNNELRNAITLNNIDVKDLARRLGNLQDDVEALTNCEEIVLDDCPFCGGGADMFHEVAKDLYRVQCVNCDATGPATDSPCLAACGWNARV